MKEIKIMDTVLNPFSEIGNDWFLITAKNKSGKINSMTGGWGNFGFIWRKPVVTVYIRPERYTYEIIEDSDYFSVCFFDKNYKKMLSYMGTVSGRDENKIEKSNLSVEEYENIPYFKEAKKIFICKKLFSQSFSEDSFHEKELLNTFYTDSGLHKMYLGEILKGYEL